MAHNDEWMPRRRVARLAMAVNWISVCALKKLVWGIPDEAIEELAARKDAARAALAAVNNASTRTPVAVARCNAAFDALEVFMRDFKRRYFLCPPLTDVDLVSLGLKPRDRHPTPSGKPTAQVMVEASLAGRGQLTVRIAYVSGDPGDPANKSFRIAYGVIAPGEALPADPESLRETLATRRKKERIVFRPGDSGKTACFAVQIENGSKKGPWGPFVFALIP
jgi:hypothetical protein